MSIFHPLLDAFFNEVDGLCGQHDPTAALLAISEKENRLRVLALASLLPSPDYGKLLEHQEDWFFEPAQVAYKHLQEVDAAFRGIGLKMPKHIARVWWQISRGMQGRFGGSFLAFLESQGNDALAVQSYLRQSKTTFPVLSAPITSAYWLDAVHRVGEIPLLHWDELRVPLAKRELQSAREFGIEKTEVHPALALSLGAWKKGCKGLQACGLEKCPRRN